MMRQALVAMVAALALFVACKRAPPKPGDKCKTEGIGQCQDPRHFLVCRGGAWRLDGCLGAAGCTTAGTSVRCDQSVGAPGDACSTAGGAACSPDAKQFLKCDGTKLVVSADCKGPAGCSHDGTQVKCDESAGVPGDMCSDDGKAACSVDAKSFLKCAQNKLAVAATCGGPKGCFIEGTTVHCDESLGADGDVCTDPKGHACSHDKKHALECKDGHLKTMKACKKGCEIKNDNVYCN